MICSTPVVGSTVSRSGYLSVAIMILIAGSYSSAQSVKVGRTVGEALSHSILRVIDKGFLKAEGLTPISSHPPRECWCARP
jgi:hypothetical protein